jgi:hypothetical protein
MAEKEVNTGKEQEILQHNLDSELEQQDSDCG